VRFWFVALPAMEDPCQTAKVLYPLPEILLLLLAGILAGVDYFSEMELWGNEQLAFLRRLLPYQHGIPSHETLGEVVAEPDPALFKACFVSWVEGLRETAPDIVAIEGKLPVVVTPGARAASHSISSLLGPAASAWCSDRRRSRA
jgi:hypothetical protein